MFAIAQSHQTSDESHGGTFHSAYLRQQARSDVILSTLQECTTHAGLEVWLGSKSVAASLLVAHGALLKSDGGELSSKQLNLVLQIHKLLRDVGVDKRLKVPDLGSAVGVGLELLCDLNGPALPDTPLELTRHRHHVHQADFTNAFLIWFQ